MAAKVDGIVKAIYENRIQEFYFKNSFPDGYKLKLVKDSKIFDNIYLTESEANELLVKLHIKTDSILFNVFKLNHEQEAYIKTVISKVHELGLIKANFSSVNATKEDLVNAVNHLKQITKDVELTSLDVEGIQQEEIYNILHEKHLEYLTKFNDVILTEVNSAS